MVKTEQQRAVAVALSNLYKAEDRLKGAKELLQEALTLIGEDNTKYSVIERIEAALRDAQEVEQALSQAKTIADTIVELKQGEPQPYRVTEEPKDGKVVVTIWDGATGVGLQFTKGESLQRYLSSLVLPSEVIDTEAARTENLTHLTGRLTAEAERLYPMEFSPLKEPKE